MRVAMKEIDNDSSNLQMKSRKRRASQPENHDTNSHDLSPPRCKKRKIVTENSHNGFVEQIVSIEETYQFGIEDKENNEVYVFDCVDSLRVVYSTNVIDCSLEELESLPPYHISDHEFAEYLSDSASSVLSQLSSTLEKWLDESDERYQNELTVRHLSVYDELVVLRRQVFTLLSHFLPKPRLPENFDCTSGDLDRYLLRIIHGLNCETTSEFEIEPCPPRVVLYKEPERHLSDLRRRVLQLLQILLPTLKLPESFDVERDLQDLINAVYTANSR